jgi:hypothetical protein
MKTEQQITPSIKLPILHASLIAASFPLINWIFELSKQSKIKRYYLRPYKKKMAEMTETEREFLTDLAWQAAKYDFDNKIQHNPKPRKVVNK